MTARILCVEDNPQNMRLVRKILKSQGYEVLEAEDGLSGLDMAQTEDPDLILMDVNLPDLDGLEVTRRIKAQDHLHQIPIVALTANAMFGDEERCLAAGCDGYIAKPVSKQKLLSNLAAYLDPNWEQKVSETKKAAESSDLQALPVIAEPTVNGVQPQEAPVEKVTTAEPPQKPQKSRAISGFRSSRNNPAESKAEAKPRSGFAKPRSGFAKQAGAEASNNLPKQEEQAKVRSVPKQEEPPKVTSVLQEESVEVTDSLKSEKKPKPKTDNLLEQDGATKASEFRAASQRHGFRKPAAKLNFRTTEEENTAAQEEESENNDI